MEEIFRDTQEQIDTFYRCVLSLELKDYKNKGMTLEQAYKLYDDWNIATIYKNGKVGFFNEETNKRI